MVGILKEDILLSVINNGVTLYYGCWDNKTSINPTITLPISCNKLITAICTLYLAGESGYCYDPYVSAYNKTQITICMYALIRVVFYYCIGVV